MSHAFLRSLARGLPACCRSSIHVDQTDMHGRHLPTLLPQAGPRHK